MLWKMEIPLSTTMNTHGTWKQTCCTLKAQEELDILPVEVHLSALLMIILQLWTIGMQFYNSLLSLKSSKAMTYIFQENHMLAFMCLMLLTS